MGGKKNKKRKKPAVGNPAAGSNNKGAKKPLQQSKKNVSVKKSGSEKSKNEAVIRAEKKVAEQKKAAEKAAKQKERESREAEARRRQEQDAERKAAKLKEREEKKSELQEKQKKKTSEKKKIKSDVSSETAKNNKQKLSANKNIAKGKTDKSFKKSYKEFSEKYNVGKIAAVFGAAVILIVVVIVLSVTLINKNYSVPDIVRYEEYKGRIESETIAFDMDMSENQQKALVKSTKIKGDKHAFGCFINEEITMSEYDEPALIEFGSIESNDCDLLLFIVDSKGTVLYQSKGVGPGKEIRSVNFFEEIPYGTNEVTAAVLGYDSETYEKVGMQTAKIKLKIGVD